MVSVWRPTLLLFLSLLSVKRMDSSQESEAQVTSNFGDTSQGPNVGSDESRKDLVLFKALFKKRRNEQMNAVKRIRKLETSEKQKKMVTLITEKVFEIIHTGKSVLESSGYIPGSGFPTEKKVQEALSNVLENTALFGDILLYLPDITHKVLKTKNEWDMLFKWSIGFSNETQLLDSATTKMVNLVAQELSLVERDPNYVNPYKKQSLKPTSPPLVDVPQRPKKKKEKRRGPRLSGSKMQDEL